MKQYLVRNSQFHVDRILILNVYLIITLFDRKKLTVNDFVVQDNLCPNHVSLLTYLPYVEGNLYHISLFFLLNFRLKKISHTCLYLRFGNIVAKSIVLVNIFSES